MSTPKEAYASLEKRFHESGALSHAQAILSWDANTYMPEGGTKVRGEQLSLINRLQEGMIKDTDVGKLLDIAEKNLESFTPWERGNIRTMRYHYMHTIAVSDALSEAKTKAGIKCEAVWRRARAANDFKMLLPHLQTSLDIAKDIANAKSKLLKKTPYNALIDQYDPGRTSEQIDTIFNELKPFLKDFLKEVLAYQKKHDTFIRPKEKLGIDKQKELCLFLAKQLGFNFNFGRLDESSHPFTGGIEVVDVRLTNRYSEKDFVSGLMGLIHETGHGLYQQQLPKEYMYQPVGQPLGMAYHESQSLLFEMQISRDPSFLKYLLPLIRKRFGVKGKTWSLSNIQNLYHHVKPSFIRVDADEVTYPFHIMLRYDIEAMFLDGQFELKDLPKIWNEKMRDYLGVVPKTDAQGCMQDIHWTWGEFGYFPAYLLGAILAAQWFNAIKADIPEIYQHIEAGTFEPITDWLKTNLHGYGSKLPGDELLKKVTRKTIDPADFIRHLETRYLP